MTDETREDVLHPEPEQPEQPAPVPATAKKKWLRTPEKMKDPYALGIAVLALLTSAMTFSATNIYRNAEIGVVGTESVIQISPSKSGGNRLDYTHSIDLTFINTGNVNLVVGDIIERTYDDVDGKGQCPVNTSRIGMTNEIYAYSFEKHFVLKAGDSEVKEVHFKAQITKPDDYQKYKKSSSLCSQLYVDVITPNEGLKVTNKHLGTYEQMIENLFFDYETSATSIATSYTLLHRKTWLAVGPWILPINYYYCCQLPGEK